MNIIEIFSEQLKDDKVITEEQLKKLKGKSLYSEYQNGDKVCWFILQGPIQVNSDDVSTINLTLKSIVERELGLLEKDYKYIESRNNIPVFEKRRSKNDGNVTNR